MPASEKNGFTAACFHCTTMFTLASEPTEAIWPTFSQLSSCRLLAALTYTSTVQRACPFTCGFAVHTAALAWRLLVNGLVPGSISPGGVFEPPPPPPPQLARETRMGNDARADRAARRRRVLLGALDIL